MSTLYMTKQKLLDKRARREFLNAKHIDYEKGKEIAAYLLANKNIFKQKKMDDMRLNPYWIDDPSDELTRIILALEDPTSNKRNIFMTLARNPTLLDRLVGMDIALAYSISESMNRVNNDSLWLSIMQAERLGSN